MLRVEIRDALGAVMISLHGRLTGEYTEPLRMLVNRCSRESRIQVDLNEVTFVDSAGEEALSLLKDLHGEFIAENIYAKDLCNRLQLTRARRRRWRREPETSSSHETPTS